MTTQKNLTLSEVEAMVERLSRRKEQTERKVESKKGPSLTREEANQLFERLATQKRPQSPPPRLRDDNVGQLSREHVNGLIERLSKQKEAPSTPSVNRGEARSQIDIDEMVTRLSVVKQPPDQHDTKSRGLKLSQSDIQELVGRLSNKEVAMEKTPDAKRTMDTSYGIVSSYAWNGFNHQAMLCNEESP